jgi:hypothetical protein
MTAASSSVNISLWEEVVDGTGGWYQLPASSFQLPASSFQLPASSFQLPASSFQLPASSYELRALTDS